MLVKAKQPEKDGAREQNWTGTLKAKTSFVSLCQTTPSANVFYIFTHTLLSQVVHDKQAQTPTGLSMEECTTGSAVIGRKINQSINEGVV